MFERILIPLDGSPLAESVLTQMPELLRRQGTEILLLRAAGYPVGANRDPKVLEEAERYLASVRGRLAAEGMNVRHVVLPGNPAETILDTALRERASVIAMSTHGRTGLARWAMGSVATKVLRAAVTPLLLVRAPGLPVEGARRVPRIVVPLDGSASAMAVLPQAMELARVSGKPLVLLHVFPRTTQPLELKTPELPLEAAEKACRAGGVPFEHEFRSGDAATHILQFCEDPGASAIAMSTHGRSGVSRWVLGSVAEKVLHAAHVPILLVRSTL